MAAYFRLRQQQSIKEAEGYLDLVLAAGKGQTLSRDFRHRMARRTLRVLERMTPPERGHKRTLYLHGQALRLLEQYEGAIAVLRDAEHADPRNVHIHLALAWCYKRIDRIDLAIATLEDALEIAPDRPIIHYNLACYWSLASNVPLALAHLSRALAKEPRYRQRVSGEPDFDRVRDHPEFRALTTVRV